MTKSCVFEDCRSTTRTNPELKFVSFIKPSYNLERAKEWVKRVGRLDFEVETISRNTFVCQKHFPPETTDFSYTTNLNLIPIGKLQ